ncbi:hypothetical protein V2J09_016054 [Rumex salicifolius]
MESSRQQEINVADLMKLIKGFVDMLILASGYQSSGLFAHWDSSNLKNAFKWAFFFEHVFRHLLTSTNSDGFLKELDSSLSELRSNPVLPQGLTCISSSTLSRARDFLMENVVHSLPLRDEHLKALLVVSTELDLDELKGSKHDHLNVFLDKLMMLSTSFATASERSVTDKVSSLQQSVEDMDIDNDNIDYTKLAVNELLKRKFAASCLLSAEKGLLILSNTVDFDNRNLSREDPQNAPAILSEAESADLTKWNQWRCRSLSYFLEKKTVQLVSGASLIFSAPKTQWAHVLKQLASSPEADDTNLLEILEIMLLGCISSQWECIIQHLTSVAYDSFTTLKQYHELCNLLQGRSRNFPSEIEAVDSKVKDILTYLTELLDDAQLKQLWKLPPVLLAAAIPFWSPLLRSYLSEVDTQLKGEHLTNRKYKSLEDKQCHVTLLRGYVVCTFSTSGASAKCIKLALDDFVAKTLPLFLLGFLRWNNTKITFFVGVS